eukprot:TRINITY_DN39723_c0_g1_i1.p1 TRINITY_DN39723_c0_g1~~TRINITY_DN39723_c0_g1_i1.p1  ORF type:complete len:725 (+),score=213.33 TRINITY_DN39723_c0_g1_i1:61-2175(+)
MLVAAVGLAAAAAAGKRRNVLFLVCDDLRPQLNEAYGHSWMHTPNFDKFAKTALTFDYAFTNFGICSASRNSFMTGRQPDNTRTWNFIDDFRTAGVSKSGRLGADWTSFPEHFKKNGFATYGHGKLYHPGKPANNDEPNSWSQDRPYYPLTTKGCPRGTAGRYCPGDTNTNDSYSDYGMVTNALDTLRAAAQAYKQNGTNFWIGVGAHFPHQPWYTSKWSREVYPPATEMPAAKHPYAPKGCPDVAFTAELDGDPTLTLDEDLKGFANSKPAGVHGSVTYQCPSPGNVTTPTYFQQQLRLGYYSAVSTSDYNMGRVLDLLDEVGVADDTVVVLTGDHGWQLGEHAEWGKHTNFELAVQVPLLIRAPWTGSAGMHTQSFTELLDLYRTVSALAGVPEPEADVDGDDVSAVLTAPGTPLKQQAFAQYSRCPGDREWPRRQPGHPDWFLNNCEKVPAKNITYMGYTVRTADWRFTEWYAWNGDACTAEFGKVHGTELYSHVGQRPHPLMFDDWENENVAADPANAKLVAQHRALLFSRFRTNATNGCPGDKPPNALIQTRAEAPSHWDSSLCGTEACLSKLGNKYGYKKVAVEGYMPGEGTEDTVTLYQCWSESLADNVVATACPAGYVAPSNLNPAGRVFSSKPDDWLGQRTAALQVWYSAEHQDHMTLALDESAQWASANGYVLLNASIGYVFAEEAPDAALERT